MMKIATHLPDEIHSFTYVKNSHWIELEDDNGHKSKLLDNALMRYSCPGCQFMCLTPSNSGPIDCPVCRSSMRQEWNRVQTCFVPEAETFFHMPQREEAEDNE